MNTKNKLKNFRVQIYVSMGLVGFFIITFLLYGFGFGIRMTTNYAPLVDTAKEIKLEGTIAHFRFKEILSSDKHENIETVWKHIDQADWNAVAMREGGTNQEGTFFASLENGDIRKGIALVRQKLAEYKKITQKILKGGETATNRTEIIQQCDILFEDFFTDADNIETKIQRLISKDLKKFRITEIILIATSVLLTLIVGAVLIRYEQRKHADIHAMESVNRSLHEEIEDRKQAEKLQGVLFNISEETGSVGDLSELYKAIHSHLDEVLDTTNLFFAIINEDETEMSFPYYVDEKDLPPDPIKLPQKLISEYVLNTKKPLFLKKQNIIDLANMKLIDLDVSGTISEVWMGAPLISQGRAIGIIVLQSYHDSNLYSESDLDILTFVSEQIAQTIEYRQAITDLQVEKTYLNELFTSSPEALALVTVDSTILHINKQFTTLFGYTEEEVFGKNIDDLLATPEYRKDAQKHTQKVAVGIQLDFETVRKKKDGTLIHVSVLGSPVKYKGDILAVYVIYRDITDRIKAAEKLKKSEIRYRNQSNELAESNSMKEMLLDVIAHDLRNPAGVIKGFAEFGLEMDPNNEILKEIGGGVDNLLSVISDATTLSKVAIGDSIKKEELDLIEIINIVTKENSSQFEFAEMTLDMKIEEKLIVNANPIIGEVFRNYISNAIKYAKPGKKIIIDTILDNGYVTVNFKDFGKTINKKDRDNIFMRNVQLGKTKGRGLGLAIVRRIAEAHNAEVGVKPNKPTGNIFYIKIPIR